MRMFCVSITCLPIAKSRPAKGKPNKADRTLAAPAWPFTRTESEAARISRPGRLRVPLLLRDLGDNPRADGPAAFANGEAQALVHRDRCDELDAQLHVV